MNIILRVNIDNKEAYDCLGEADAVTLKIAQNDIELDEETGDFGLMTTLHLT